jgi:hypothetical protein
MFKIVAVNDKGEVTVDRGYATREEAYLEDDRVRDWDMMAGGSVHVENDDNCTVPTRIAYIVAERWNGIIHAIKYVCDTHERAVVVQRALTLASEQGPQYVIYETEIV